MISDSLFSKTQQQVLGLLFGQPDRSFYTNELITLAGVGSGAVQRELARLAGSGLVTVTRIGNQKHYQANAISPVYDELRSLVQKTFGLADILRELLLPLVPRLHAAFVYGSVAKGKDVAASDIDLMILSDDLSYSDLFMLLPEAEIKLGRPVNPTLYTRAELDQRIGEKNSFITRVLAQPKIWLFGDADALTA